MDLKHLFSNVRWAAAFFSCLSMSVSSSAIGMEAEKISRAQVEAFINETNLNKIQTWAEFFEKTKSNYPPEVAAKFQEFVNFNPGLKVPEVKLKAAQNSNGQQTPVLEVYENGKTHTVQIIGEEEKWAKIDGITLRESDIENPANGLIRLQTSDINLKNEADAYLAKHNILPDQHLELLRADFSRFKGFPRMTPALWTSMSKSQRKEFIKQIGAVWEAANAVNSLNKNAKNNKTSLLENYLRHLVLSDAVAADTDEPSYDNTKAKTLKDLQTFLSSNPALLKAFNSNIWTLELDKQLVQFEISAERESTASLSQCLNQVSSHVENAEVQKKACENFHQALLINERFIAPLRDLSCKGTSHYIGRYAESDTAALREEKDKANRREINPDQEPLCACDKSTKRVKFNESCDSTASTASVAEAKPVATSAQPVPPATSDAVPSAPASSPRKSSGSNIWPLAIGGAGLGLLIGMLFSKGGKKKTAQTSTTNQTVPATCPAPQIGKVPNCSCGPCTPPQQIYNFVTCQCTNLPGGIICPNNEAAPNGDVSKCARCSDGSYKTTESCPVATPANSKSNVVVPVTR